MASPPLSVHLGNKILFILISGYQCGVAYLRNAYIFLNYACHFYKIICHYVIKYYLMLPSLTCYATLLYISICNRYDNCFQGIPFRSEFRQAMSKECK
ncbi:hypothetical protein T03_1071, partial [Trichinella britovi]